MCKQGANTINTRISLVTALTTAGDLITEIAIIYYVFSVHGLAMSAMAIFFLEIGKYLAKFSLPLVTKIKRQKEYLIFTQIFSGIVVLLIFGLIKINAPLYVIWASYIIHSCFSEQFDSIKEAYSQLLARPYGEEFQKTMQSTNTLGLFIGRLLGTLTVFLLLSTNNYAAAFTIDALTFLVGSIILYKIIPKEHVVLDSPIKKIKFSLNKEKRDYLILKTITNIIPVTVFNYMLIIFVGENYSKDILHTATTYIFIALGAVGMSLALKYTKFGQKLLNNNMLWTSFFAAMLMATTRLAFASGTEDTFLIGLIALIIGGCANMLNYHALAVIRRNISTNSMEHTILISLETTLSIALMILILPALFLVKSNFSSISNIVIIQISLIPLLCFYPILRSNIKKHGALSKTFYKTQ